MRVLGLDPGLRHTGWGVIDVTGNHLVHIADGVVHAATDLPLAMRLVSLFRQISSVLERFQPDEAAVEETFVNRNPASTLKLGVARGVVRMTDRHGESIGRIRRADAAARQDPPHHHLYLRFFRVTGAHHRLLDQVGRIFCDR